MEEAVVAVEAGFETINSNRQTFFDISSAVHSLHEGAAEVSELAAGIALGAGQVREQIEEVAAVAEQSSASTEQVSAATEETSAGAQDVSDAAQTRRADRLQPCRTRRTLRTADGIRESNTQKWRVKNLLRSSTFRGEAADRASRGRQTAAVLS